MNATTSHRCSRCAHAGAYSAQCPECKAWFTMARPVTIRSAPTALSTAAPPAVAPEAWRPRAAPLEPTIHAVHRIATGLGVLDQAFGSEEDGSSGFPVGTVSLLSGRPGAGKTTLALLIAEALLPLGVVYGATEGGPEYYGRLCRRTGRGIGVPILHTCRLADVLSEATRSGARVVVVDQLHSLEPRYKALEHLREIAAFTQGSGRSCFVVGERTLAGNVRGGLGPEFLVDVVLGLEKPDLSPGALGAETADPQQRWLVFSKNRYGLEGRWPLRLGAKGWIEDGPAND
jgi:predicted ATP-dependent serine protease